MNQGIANYLLSLSRDGDVYQVCEIIAAEPAMLYALHCGSPLYMALLGSFDCECVAEAIRNSSDFRMAVAQIIGRWCIETNCMLALGACVEMQMNVDTGAVPLIVLAACGGDADVVDKMLRLPLIDLSTNATVAALAEAILRGHSEIVRILIRFGVDPRTRTSDGVFCLDAMKASPVKDIRVLAQKWVVTR